MKIYNANHHQTTPPQKCLYIRHIFINIYILKFDLEMDLFQQQKKTSHANNFIIDAVVIRL